MKGAQDWMKNNGIMPRISFNDGQAFTVKLLGDKIDTIPDAFNKGAKLEGMKFLCEHEGEKKTFFTTSVGLIGKLAAVEEGETVTIQMKKANGKSFFVVTKDGQEVTNGEEGGEIADDEVPSTKTDW